jgi:hypothetical protein
MTTSRQPGPGTHRPGLTHLPKENVVMAMLPTSDRVTNVLPPGRVGEAAGPGGGFASSARLMAWLLRQAP